MASIITLMDAHRRLTRADQSGRFHQEAKKIIKKKITILRNYIGMLASWLLTWGSPGRADGLRCACHLRVWAKEPCAITGQCKHTAQTEACSSVHEPPCDKISGGCSERTVEPVPNGMPTSFCSPEYWLQAQCARFFFQEITWKRNGIIQSNKCVRCLHSTTHLAPHKAAPP